MPRKPRADSVSSSINAMLNAAKPLADVPEHVRIRPDDLPFWEAIMRARARDEWTEADLVTAAQLARCQRDIETESVALEAEGSVVENARGTQIMNPRHTVLQQLSQRQLALMRSLGIAGLPAHGRKDDLVNKRKIQRQSERALAEIEEDDLLAR